MKIKVWMPSLAILIFLTSISSINCGSSNPSGGHEEESGQQFAKGETYDNVRNGARLMLNYNPNTSAFVGTVENTTNQTLSQVRVEVHLSNGTELGPTTPKDLAPDEKMDVTLDATGENFNTWSAHPEVGSGEGGAEH